jgi:hypothetical protein
MKKSEFKEYLKNEIVSVLQEASNDDLETQKELNKELEKTVSLAQKLTTEAGPEDIKAQQDLNKELELTKKAATDLVNTSKSSPLAEEEDEYDVDVKEPTSADLKKKDSVATTAKELQKIVAKMKDLAKEFKEAKGDLKDQIKDKLKDLTAKKKKLEGLL